MWYKMEDFSLDEPIKTRLPNGYRVCPNCWAYYHHPFHWCKHCSGVRTYKEKEMSWREFLIRTSHEGAGPINTIRGILHRQSGIELGGKLPIKEQKVYDEAEEIYRKNGGWKGYRTYKGRMIVSGKEVTHWVCESCSFMKEHGKGCGWAKHCPNCNDYLHPARIIDGQIEFVDKVK